MLLSCSLIFQGDPGEDGRAVSFSVFTLKYFYKRRIIYRLFQIDRLKYYQCNLGFFASVSRVLLGCKVFQEFQEFLVPKAKRCSI